MVRKVIVAAAQVGRIDIDTPIDNVIDRLIVLLEEAHKHEVKLVNYPELAFTTFFARHLIENEDELNKWFVKSKDITKQEPYSRLFDKAKEHKISISIGYAELTSDDRKFNTSIFVNGDGKIISKYRKIHLPGDAEPVEGAPFQHLEKKYFQTGDIDWKAFRWSGDDVKELNDYSIGETGYLPIVGQLICNDRRWSESWRVLGLQGTELVLIGYNTPSDIKDLDGVQVSSTEESKKMAVYHNEICLEYNTYANCCYSICSARCGNDDGKYDMIGGSTIIGPSGMILAKTKTEEDELIWKEIDLDECKGTRNRIFNFEKHRQPDKYKLICEQKGIIEPKPL
ncbi:transferase activity protein [[Candida] boidinii]|nr:transferase activity protein [[Candida] boidinii]OWB78260.1 transferase activity protein [[Candida] boidinii]